MPAPLRTTISIDSFSKRTASSRLLYSSSFWRLSARSRGAGDADGSRLNRRGETDACLPMPSDKGGLRMREGESDMLRVGDNRGFNHLDVEVGVLGTL